MEKTFTHKIALFLPYLIKNIRSMNPNELIFFTVDLIIIWTKYEILMMPWRSPALVNILVNLHVQVHLKLHVKLKWKLLSCGGSCEASDEPYYSHEGSREGSSGSSSGGSSGGKKNQFDHFQFCIQSVRPPRARYKLVEIPIENVFIISCGLKALHGSDMHQSVVRYG